MTARLRDRRWQLIPCRDPADADRRATARGLDEHRQSEAFAVLELHRVLLWPQHDLIADRQALGGEQLLGELLVHARRTRQHTGTDVRHPGQLEQPLNGAVLAIRTVQYGKDDVHRGEQLPRPLSQGEQFPFAARVGWQRQRGARRSGHLGQPPVGDREGVRTAVGQHPGSAGRDADRDHLEPLGVEVAQDAACGNTRNRVFGASSAVDDGDADATGGAGFVAGSHNLERLPGLRRTAGRSALSWPFTREPVRNRRSGHRCPRCRGRCGRSRR